MLLRALVCSLLLVACGVSHEDPPDEGDVRTLRLGGNRIVEALVVDSHDALCGLVSSPLETPLRTLDYGCFDATGTFQPRATIGTLDIWDNQWQLALDEHDDVSVVGFVSGELAGTPVTPFGSCLIRIVRAEVSSVCLDEMFTLWAAAVDGASGRTVAMVEARINASLGSTEVPHSHYVVEGLPLTTVDRMHPVDVGGWSRISFVARVPDGWLVAGDYVSPTDSVWGLPDRFDRAAPFWMQLDATLAPVFVGTSASPYETSVWRLAPDGTLVGVWSAFSDPPIARHAVAIAMSSSPVEVGTGGYITDVAANDDAIALMGTFGNETVQFGSFSLDSRRVRTFIVSLTRAGDVRSLRAPSFNPTSNLVVFRDGTLAVAASSSVHLLAPE